MRKSVLVNIYIDHSLSHKQLVGGLTLSDGLTQALMQPIRLHEATSRIRHLTPEELVGRLLEPDWIRFYCDEGMQLDIWVTQKALSVEFMDTDYQWEGTLRQPAKLIELQVVAERLARQFGAQCALVAPSRDLKAAVVREFFAEAISVDELVMRVSEVVGEPFKAIDDAKVAMENYDGDVEIESVDRGYFFWCWPTNPRKAHNVRRQ